MKKSNVAIFSFFSGCGILDLGFEASGYESAFVNESHGPFLEAYKYARKQMNYPDPKYGYYHGDINDLLTHKDKSLELALNAAKENGDMIGFIGGPPCPDFSVGGKNKGKTGSNGKLSSTYIELIKDSKPDFFLFENVKGLWKTARHREFYESLKRKLNKAGYALSERLVNSLEYGAPQDRDRILLFGIRKELVGSSKNVLTDFPWESHIRYAIQDVKSLDWATTTEFKENSVSSCPKDAIKELTVKYWFDKNKVEEHPNSEDHFVPRAGIQRMKTIAEGDVSKKSYKRLHRWRYSPTVAYGNNEVHLHPYKVRRISASEAMALQSLPKEFILPPTMSLSDMFKTIGNGVPYILAVGIAETIKDYLENQIWQK